MWSVNDGVTETHQAPTARSFLQSTKLTFNINLKETYCSRFPVSLLLHHLWTIQYMPGVP